MGLPSLKAGTQFIQPLRRVGFPAQSLSKKCVPSHDPSGLVVRCNENPMQKIINNLRYKNNRILGVLE